MIYAWFISRNTYRVDSALNMSMVQECTGNNTQYPQHAQRIQSIAAKGLIRAVHWYQRRISPLFGPSCKYYPTCSNYALTALLRFGAARGSVLTVLRLLRCRPWSRGGIDDVPQQFSIFYRFSWSKAHEEPRLTPLPTEESTD